jgi:hypothetical protein
VLNKVGQFEWHRTARWHRGVLIATAAALDVESFVDAFIDVKALVAYNGEMAELCTRFALLHSCGAVLQHPSIGCRREAGNSVSNLRSAI